MYAPVVSLRKLIVMKSQHNMSSQCTVQFNYNFTHAWDFTHGNMQFFASQMSKFAVELIIYLNERCYLHETRDVIDTSHVYMVMVSSTRTSMWLL